MKKLISAVAVIVLSVASLSTAAPGQGAMGRAADRARERADEPPYRGPNRGPKANKKAIKRDAKWHRRDVKADERELRRLRADLRSAERARDWRRAQRTRAAISRLEYQIRADREYNRRYERNARYNPRNDSWWARHLGRTGG